MPYWQDLRIIAVVALCTLATRLFPFVVFGRHGSPSSTVRFLGSMLPGAVMAILIVYCIRDVIPLADVALLLARLGSMAIVVLLHLWKHNNLLSIGGGTACYMFLVQTVL